MYMGNAKSPPPTTSADFDREYQRLLTLWGDIRMPREVADLARDKPAKRILELGCGVGRFARRLARDGHQVLGVDFSPVAIAKARASVARDAQRPDFVVGDVTNLRNVDGPFDLAFDVGCYHCLDAEQQARYAAEMHRLVAPGGTHLFWAMDDAPSRLPLTASDIEKVFSPRFTLRREEAVRRRFVRSHWYWLERRA